MNGAVLQEAVVVEFVLRNQQCPDCQASYTTGAWKAIVQVSPPPKRIITYGKRLIIIPRTACLSVCWLQVRQRVDHKRTFLHLEQLILKHNAHSHALQIQVCTPSLLPPHVPHFYYFGHLILVDHVECMSAYV